METSDSAELSNSDKKAGYSRLLVGPFAVVVTAAVAKSYILSSTISENWLELFLYLFKWDLLPLGIILVLLVVNSFIDNSRFISFIVFLLCVSFIADCLLVLFLNQRLNFYDFYRFFPEIKLAIDIKLLSNLIFFVPLVLAFYWSKRIKVSQALLSGLVGLACIIFSTSSSFKAPSTVERYSSFILQNLAGFSQWDTTIDTYSDSELHYYNLAYNKHPRLDLGDQRPNVVLVILESLSSYHSLKTSGLNDHLTEFDELASEGTLFINAFANFEASEGGIVALLGGYPPILYPNSGRNLNLEFSYQRSAVSEFNELGYFTDFLTGTYRDFLGMDMFVLGRGVRFDRAHGLEEVEVLRTSPRYSFGNPADELIYEVAVKQASEHLKKESPFFMTIVTTSTHFPYVDPLGRESTVKNKWSYGGSRVKLLSDMLRTKGFYDNGILIVTGDHREMEVIGEKEIARYGDSAKARIPLLLIGKNIKKDTIDKRFIQQSDVFPLLNKMITTDEPLSPNPIWVERYTVSLGNIGDSGNLEVFSEDEAGMISYKALTSGTSIKWASDKPKNYHEIEHSIHRQMAAHQNGKDGVVYRCNYEVPSPVNSKPKDSGIYFDIYSGNGFNRQLGKNSPHFLTSSFLSPKVGLDLPKITKNLATPYTLGLHGYLKIPEEGSYWLRVEGGDGMCVAVKDKIVIDTMRDYVEGFNEFRTGLKKGLVPINIRYASDDTTKAWIKLLWKTPSSTQWEEIPAKYLFR